MLGIAGITLIYVAVNAAYLIALGFDGARHTPTPAADVMELAGGPWGGQAICLLVMLSALGAINGMVLTGTRVYAVWGADYRRLAWLGTWNRRAIAPTAAIIVQANIAIALVLLVGTDIGRGVFDSALHTIGVSGLRWDTYFGGFETLLAATTPIYWILSLLTGIAVFVLRTRDASSERPYAVPLYPLPPLAYCAMCAFMLYASVAYARWLALVGLVPLAIGATLSMIIRPVRADVTETPKPDIELPV
jgi:amino acid transporter